MKMKFLAFLTIMFCSCLVLCACTKKNNETVQTINNGVNVATYNDGLPLLDRKTIIEQMPQTEVNNEAVTQNESVYVLLDNSLSVSHYTNSDTLFNISMEICGGLFTNVSTFRGYTMTDLLIHTEGNETGDLTKVEYMSSSSEFFTETTKASSYSNSDKSAVAHSLENLINLSESGTKSLYVVVSDLFITDDSGESHALIDLADVMNGIVRSKDNNVAIIALQSMCYSGISTYIDSDLNSRSVKSISRGVYGRDKVLSQYIGSGNGAKRPIYLLLMGNAELVTKYEKAIIAQLQQSSKYNETDVKSLSLDTFPISHEKLPQARPLSNPIMPILSDNFGKYAKELPIVDPALSFVFTKSLRNSETGLSNAMYKWDDYITQRSIPFWRVWDEKIDSGNEDFSISFEVDKGVTVNPEEIVVRYFVVDKNGKTISGIDKGNEYVNIGQITKDGSTLNIPISLMELQLAVNQPLLFLFDITLEKEIPKAIYTPLAYSNESELSWIYDWTFTADQYFETAYWWENTKYNKDGSILRKAGWRFWLDGSWGKPKDKTFELYNKTLNFADFVATLYERRQTFINEKNQPRIDDSVHQYAMFGLVVRQSYAKEQSAGVNTEMNIDDNGGYAFSLTEIGTINREMKMR